MHWALYVLAAVGVALVAAVIFAVHHFRATVRAHVAFRAADVRRQEEGRRHAEARYTIEKLAAAGAAEPGHRARIEELRDVLERAERPGLAAFPVSGPCAEVIDSFRGVANGRELLYSESGDGRWLQVRGDRALLKWAVSEIFRNVQEHAD